MALSPNATTRPTCAHYVLCPLFPILYGVDSVPIPIEERRRIWQLIAGDWKLSVLDKLAREVSLGDLEPEIDRILKGEQTGRVLVTLQ